MTAIATGAQASGGRAPRRQDARSRSRPARWVALSACQAEFQHTVGWRNGGGGLDRRPGDRRRSIRHGSGGASGLLMRARDEGTYAGSEH